MSSAVSFAGFQSVIFPLQQSNNNNIKEIYCETVQTSVSLVKHWTLLLPNVMELEAFSLCCFY